MDNANAVDLVRRVALPSAALGFFVLALVLPAIRTWRRTGVWPIVVARSASPYQRLFAWVMRAFGLAVVGWLAAYAALGPAAVGVIAPPPALEGAGWALMLLALAVLMTAQAQMGAAWRVGIDHHATPLVTHGLYRLVRNPIYSAMALVLAGVVLVAPSVWSLAAAAGVVAALALQTRLEERHLVGLHGPRYLGYAARVGRFVPGVGRLHSDD
jgi:protein-S-isoprenylcysteine O-methyltransferase Ste14